MDSSSSYRVQRSCREGVGVEANARIRGLSSSFREREPQVGKRARYLRLSKSRLSRGLELGLLSPTSCHLRQNETDTSKYCAIHEREEDRGSCRLEPRNDARHHVDPLAVRSVVTSVQRPDPLFLLPSPRRQTGSLSRIPCAAPTAGTYNTLKYLDVSTHHLLRHNPSRFHKFQSPARHILTHTTN